MPFACELCGSDLSSSSSKLVGRRCCVPCAQALFDGASAAKRIPSGQCHPLLCLRDEISALAEKASATARGKRALQLDYGRGRADAHNYDVALVLCRIALEEKRKREEAP